MFDFVVVKRSILGISEPSGIYWKAADCNKDHGIYLSDFVVIKRYILGLGDVNQ